MTCIEIRKGKRIESRDLRPMIDRHREIGLKRLNVDAQNRILTGKFKDGSYHQSTWADSGVLSAFVQRRQFRGGNFAACRSLTAPFHLCRTLWRLLTPGACGGALGANWIKPGAA